MPIEMRKNTNPTTEAIKAARLRIASDMIVSLFAFELKMRPSVRELLQETKGIHGLYSEVKYSISPLLIALGIPSASTAFISSNTRHGGNSDIVKDYMEKIPDELKRSWSKTLLKKHITMQLKERKLKFKKTWVTRVRGIIGYVNSLSFEELLTQALA